MGNIKFKKKPIANSGYVNKVKLPLKVVDDLALKLATEYDNLDYMPWYASIITEFGDSQVQEWYSRAKDAIHPGKVFTTYATQARKNKRMYEMRTFTSENAASGSNDEAN